MRTTWRSWETVAYSIDGRFIFAALSNGAVQVWDANTKEDIDKPRRSHSSIVRSISCSPNGRFFASTGDDGKICIYDIPQQKADERSLRSQWWKRCNRMLLEDGWIRDHGRTLLLWVPPAHRPQIQSGSRVIISEGVSRTLKVNIDNIYRYSGRK